MRKIANITVLLLLLLAMTAIQFTSAQPVRRPIPPNSLGICLLGWPVGYHLSFAKGTATGGVEFENNKLYYRQAILDALISLVLFFLAYVAITNGIIASQFKFTILELLAATAGIGIAITYFTWNHDIFLWNCRITLGSPDNPLVIRTMQRPFWQNAIVAIFIFLSSSTVAHLLLTNLRKRKISNGG